MQVQVLGLGPVAQTFQVTSDTTVSDLTLMVENRTFLPSSCFQLVGEISEDATIQALVVAEDGMRPKWRKKRMRRLRRKRRKMRQRAR